MQSNTPPASWYEPAILFTEEASRIVRPHVASDAPCTYKSWYFPPLSAGSSAVRRIPEALSQQREGGKVVELLDAVSKTQRLDDDWNAYDSPKPTGLARDIVISILLATPAFRVPDRIAPSAQGGIGIFFYQGDKYADIECFNTGEILGTTLAGDNEPDIWNINFANYRDALKKIGDFLGA